MRMDLVVRPRQATLRVVKCLHDFNELEGRGLWGFLNLKDGVFFPEAGFWIASESPTIRKLFCVSAGIKAPSATTSVQSVFFNQVDGDSLLA
jgi:hypothetical protein